MFSKYRVHMVDGWRQAHQWSSVRLAAFGGAVMLGLKVAPESVLSHVPEWLLSGLSIVALASIILAPAARITQVEKKDVGTDKPAD